MSEEQRHKIDDYELINCIASGTHSQIWEASEAGGRHVALKLLVPEAFREREQISVLKHEAKVQKSLSHPNFIRLHKIVVTKRHAYIVMDFFRAPNLKVQIAGDRLEAQARFRKLADGLCIALAYLHDKGWIHRDLKPENILFNKSSELRLIDFSLSVRMSLFGGKPKIIQGTRTYMAPETIRKKGATAQTDMYSLGVTLFEVLTGQPPFVASSPDLLLNKHLKELPPPPSFYNKNVTPELDKLVLRMLSKKPEKRHRDMNELLAEFRALKPFKEDIEELKARLERERKETAEAGGDLSKAWVLDSRTDAMRSKSGQKPQRPSKKRRPPKQPAAEQQRAGQQPQQPQPQQQFAPVYQQQPGGFPYPPQFAPMFPAGPPPQYVPPPGYPQFPPGYTGQPQGGAPVPQHQMPQPPPQHQQPPQPMPGQPAPGHGPAPAAPAPQPPPEQPQRPPQAAGPGQQPAAPPPQSSESQDQVSPDEAQLRPQAPIPSDRHASQRDADADLPLMDELPDIV